MYVNHLDLGPRFAGVTMAVTCIPATLAAFFSPYVCDVIVSGQDGVSTLKNYNIEKIENEIFNKKNSI